MVEGNHMDTMIVLVDLDGTMSVDNDRRQFVTNGSKNYDAYHRASINDKARPGIIPLMKVLVNAGHRVEIWTARSDAYYDITHRWASSRDSG